MVGGLKPTPIAAPARKRKAAQSRPRPSNSTRTVSRQVELDGVAVILADDELEETAQYAGCFAFLHERVGLSFKGLKREFVMRLGKAEILCEPGTFLPLKMPARRVALLRDAVALWDAMHLLIRVEQSALATDERIEGLRAEFRGLYCAFCHSHGDIRDVATLLRFDGANDGRLSMLLALEHEDTGEVADLLAGRVHYPIVPLAGQQFFGELVDRVVSAYQCLRAESATVDLARIGEFSGATEAECEAVLVEADLVLRIPEHIDLGGLYDDFTCFDDGDGDSDPRLL